MAKLMNGDAAEIDRGRHQPAAIGIPGVGGVEDDVGFFKNVVAKTEQSHGEGAGAEGFAKDGGGKKDRVLVIARVGDDGREEDGREPHVREVRVPDVEGVQGGLIEGRAAVGERFRRAERELHHHRPVKRPGFPFEGETGKGLSSETGEGEEKEL